MDLILILKTIILGIVEGITEWLPISSTGHLILVDEFINLNVSAAFKEMFDVVIQLGAIMAVVVLYFHKLNPLSPKKNRKQKHETMVLWYKVIFAVLPAAVIGILFDDAIHDRFFNPVVVAATLIIYGVLFIVIENHNEGSRRRGMDSLSGLTYRMAFIIGVFQVLSLIPGTSRSGATIVGGILIGCSRTVAAEFSFFLGIPVMFGASLLKILKFGLSFTGTELVVLAIGMIVSFLVSIVSIKFLMGYVKRHDFKAFGVYRIILGILVIGYFMFFK
ncbi:undecaprenyl-diphosphate phosphatase [Anaerostipes caccae]|uniref:undecaprenyl-diphosphate phosphatase n=1 Tax=Anaerostipes caccae TaxID=105841 RepID=UPI001D08B51A|nr:undecaprenyl-diphosphate phosphatase [Anaerostipes caccae]MCB6293870.1 undecaprenyl-diphosphate phosphatase [Anaerostipes caccae]MCB6336377.1 undecaprenyl-diphosphate phosphatase [Anaerostipes caccae]MCB6339481.1 undecaprenyl-diphosphate phosphatase [Anaerostipes caccae]MCB6351593.1 undecaprenyl-diphosphate phosphatase [Anaerostipes caccae]MCB6359782.1 undecaprenyl-diphosphate phosphatase [Anaerostipes caccae]